MEQYTISSEVARLIQNLTGDDLIALVAVMLIFGTGLLSVALFGGAQVIRAIRGASRVQVEELLGRLDRIEEKISVIDERPRAFGGAQVEREAVRV